MKRIIGGMLYDTETAEQIAEWDNGCPPTDRNFHAETLYRTKSGAYFRHGKGGDQSPYRKACDSNSWTAGEQIIPMADNDVYEWLQVQDLTGALEQHFGDRIHDA